MPGTAIVAALDLARSPSLAPLMRIRPLPDDMLSLIRVAAGNGEAIAAASVAQEVWPHIVQEAAAFYIKEILFHSRADHYRVLGAAGHASRQELRTHMRALLGWLHPDHNDDVLQSVFFGRVASAWQALASAEDRAAYDMLLDRGLAGAAPPSRRHDHRASPAWVPIPIEGRRPSSALPARRLLWIAAGLVLLGLAFVAPIARPVASFPLSTPGENRPLNTDSSRGGLAP